MNEDSIYESSAIHPLEEPTRIGFWRSESGEIAISEMSDRHLRNAISFAERKKLNPEKINELRVELTKREAP